MRKFALLVLAFVGLNTAPLSADSKMPPYAYLWNTESVDIKEDGTAVPFNEQQVNPDDTRLSVSDGKVMVNESGEYVLVYSVTYDSAPPPSVNLGDDHQFAVYLDGALLQGSELYPKVKNQSAGGGGQCIQLLSGLINIHLDAGSSLEFVYVKGGGFQMTNDYSVSVMFGATQSPEPSRPVQTREETSSSSWFPW